MFSDACHAVLRSLQFIIICLFYWPGGMEEAETRQIGGRLGMVEEIETSKSWGNIWEYEPNKIGGNIETNDTDTAIKRCRHRNQSEYCMQNKRC